MDTSNPAAFVNAELLRMYVGRRVRAVIQVLRNDGGSIFGKSTNEQELVIKGHPPNPPTTFVEVIGIADSNRSIQAEIWTNFGDNFGLNLQNRSCPVLEFNLDVSSYNTVCQLANGDFKHLFI
ncbi:hypothetical protein SASPL_105533 [Salvia splendens]|uniref:Replication factor A3 n=1 Tax=Salvia splendens TaxID=180675 RepID=A0A8X8YLX0_SALSN|nr:hypothetical protein SASPL_105533 [Salvia splendens]